jgi:hypothetical protein
MTNFHRECFSRDCFIESLWNFMNLPAREMTYALALTAGVSRWRWLTKGLVAETVPWGFIGKDVIAFSGQKSRPRARRWRHDCF